MKSPDNSQNPLLGSFVNGDTGLWPHFDVIKAFLKTLKTHKKTPFSPAFTLKTPRKPHFFDISCIFLITFFGENEIMCTFAPK